VSRVLPALLLPLALVGCTRPPDSLVLFLRQGRPGPAVRFGRVDVDSNDFGSLSLDPPSAGEDRSCGSVVAFGAAEGLELPPRLELREVLYQLWWYSGSGRGQLGLNAPGLGEALASLSVVDVGLLGVEGHREAGYSLAQVRVPVDQALTADQLAGLYLSLDVGGASVKVATCPVRPSLVVLNPAEDFEPPAWATLSSPGCLPPTLALTPPPAEPFAAPRWDRELDQGVSMDSLSLAGEAVLHRGDLEIGGELSLEGATLVLAPGADGEPPRVVLAPGASLVLREGSQLVAKSPSTGFHLRAEAGSRVEIVDSTVRWGGFLQLRDDGRVTPTEVALDLEGADAVVRGSRLEGNIVALRLSGGGATVEGNRFSRNATAIEGRDSGGRVVGNHSDADGLFLRLDHSSAGWVVQDNTIQHSLDMGLWLDGAGAQHTVRGNHILDANAGIAITDRGDYAIVEDNRVRTCRYPVVRHGLEPDPAILELNTLEQSAFEGCPPEPR
jgi:hypothetical protein